VSRLAAARCIGHPGQAMPRKAARHLLTVAGRVASRPAASLLVSPSASARMIWARNARRHSVFPAASQDRSVVRWSPLNVTSAARIPAD
jgi:hypothetical protein